MKKTLIKTVGVLMAVVMLFGTVCVQSSALGNAQTDLSFGKTVSKAFTGFADILIRGIAALLPNPKSEKLEDYEAENFYEGMSASGDRWLCGFASESLIPDDIESGKYTTAGYFSNFPANYIEGVMDDQRVAAVCLGTGGSTAVFISLDGFGMSGANVREIRERLEAFARENGIGSINVTLSHSHYCIDTHGLGGDLAEALKCGFKSIITRQTDLYESTNKQFMHSVFEKASEVTRQAFSSMSEGTLSFGCQDISDMLRDGQTPTAFDRNVNRLRFVPDDSAKNEIWLVNMAAHPTELPQSTKLVSADYPGAIVRYAKEYAGADAAFYQGAQCGISTVNGALGLTEQENDTLAEVNAYGRLAVERMMAISNEQEISPRLAVRHTELVIPLDNSVLQFAYKMRLLNNKAYHTTGFLKDMVLITEIGYCELGDTLAIALVPGEISPEIIFGGTKSADEAWNECDWEYEPIQDMTGGRKLLCFGLTNDQIGYIVPDNDYANTFAQLFSKYYGEGNSHYQEMISTSKQTASIIAQGFEDLI